jgi:hypothetical protein
MVLQRVNLSLRHKLQSKKTQQIARWSRIWLALAGQVWLYESATILFPPQDKSTAASRNKNDPYSNIIGSCSCGFEEVT